MSTIARTSFHRNATVIVLFDATAMHLDNDLKTIRARFGRGVLKSVPHVTRPCNQADVDEFNAMLRDRDASPAPRPTMTAGQLMDQIKSDLARCKSLGRRQDALLAKVRGIMPLCGGSPEADTRSAWSSRVAEIMNGIDDPDGNPVTDSDVARVAAMG